MKRRKIVAHQPKKIKIKRVDLKQIKAGGGVLYRRSNYDVEVLLIKRNGVWDLPKGKLEEGEEIGQCAVREVAEEVGISMPDIDQYLCDTYHEYEESGELIGKTTVWYSMIHKPNVEMSPQTEEGITDLQWFALSEAVEKVGFENLRSVLLTFSKRLDKK